MPIVFPDYNKEANVPVFMEPRKGMLSREEFHKEKFNLVPIGLNMHIASPMHFVPRLLSMFSSEHLSMSIILDDTDVQCTVHSGARTDTFYLINNYCEYESQRIGVESGCFYTPMHSPPPGIEALNSKLRIFYSSFIEEMYAALDVDDRYDYTGADEYKRYCYLYENERFLHSVYQLIHPTVINLTELLTNESMSERSKEINNEIASLS